MDVSSFASGVVLYSRNKIIKRINGATEIFEVNTNLIMNDTSTDLNININESYTPLRSNGKYLKESTSS